MNSFAKAFLSIFQYVNNYFFLFAISVKKNFYSFFNFMPERY